MREIKFRAWNESEKIMISWSTMKQSVFNSGKTNFLYDILIAKKSKYAIMQYTGLKDRNGKEIYEGDICLYIGTNMSSMEIKFEIGSFVGVGPFNTHPISVYLDAIDFESIEVIGNIYEDKHLLL